ncbi:hypothetical protein [Xenorhabdus sp. KK7.4]|uniref:hypothetical protein n=1 Tax=Xenorhabdus sp. KK7.4 TaxID=1851572 RepID=UPI000C04E806|nr:hypothetical protein [Xenorhabdus sp. KK7.4]PHM50149.1 hypothetical protein Xekk_04227 [Xenorhabdus sp. KK7.4]
MTDLEYWQECISCGADDCGLVLTDEQLLSLAKTVSNGHGYYGMAFYSPPDSDRYAEIEREWKSKLNKLQSEFNSYKINAENTMKKALNIDADITIEPGGKVSCFSERWEMS